MVPFGVFEKIRPNGSLVFHSKTKKNVTDKRTQGSWYTPIRRKLGKIEHVKFIDGTKLLKKPV